MTTTALQNRAIALLDWIERNRSRRGQVALAMAMIITIWSIATLSQFVQRTQPFSPALIVEQVLETTSARNYVERGFWKNLFLADYSSSPQDVDHPYLYTHMPSGPTVLLGAMLKAGLDLTAARIAFTFITLLGGICFFFLIWKVTRIPEIAVLAYLFYMTDYPALILYSDHFVHTFGGLNYFGGLLFYFLYLDNPSRLNLWSFVACLSIGFISSFFTSIPLFVVLVALHLLYRSNPHSKRLLLTLIATGVGWATALLGRNIVVFGPEIALQDLLYTLGNRTVGKPTRVELIDFFARHKIVLWGVGKVQAEGLKNWLFTAVELPMREYGKVLLWLAAFYFGLKIKGDDVLRRLASILLIFTCIYSFHLIFFAQGSNYMHPPFFRMFRIGTMVVAQLATAYAIIYLARMAKFESARFLSVGRFAAIHVCILLFFCISIFRNDLRRQIRDYQAEAKSGFRSSELASYEKLKALPEGDVLTNIDALMLNFFAPNNLVFGGCDEQGIAALDVNRCPSSFVNPSTKEKAQPKLVFFSLDPLMVPGYQSCLAECQIELLARLKERHDLIEQESNGRWFLFRIQGTSPQSQSARGP